MNVTFAAATIFVNEMQHDLLFDLPGKDVTQQGWLVRSQKKFNLTYHQAFLTSLFLRLGIFELPTLCGLPEEGGQPKTKTMHALVFKQPLLHMAYTTL